LWVNYPEGGRTSQAIFNLIDHVSFAIDEKAPFRKAFVSMHGGLACSQVHALLEVDTKNPNNNPAITLSPIRLDGNGRAQLSDKKDFCDAVAWAAAWLFAEAECEYRARSSNVIIFENLANAFRKKFSYCIVDSTVAGRMVGAKIMEIVGTSWTFVRPLMTDEKFQETFGSLPKVGDASAQATPADWMPEKIKLAAVKPTLNLLIECMRHAYGWQTIPLVFIAKHICSLSGDEILTLISTTQTDLLDHASQNGVPDVVRSAARDLANQFRELENNLKHGKPV
jgi:hypothetical protein